MSILRARRTPDGWMASIAVGGLLTVLLLLPAIVCSGQRLSLEPAHAAGAQRYHKSLDLTPDPPQPAADTTGVRFVSPAPECGAFTCVGDRPVLPVAPDLVDADSLRAPPTVLPAV